MLLVAAIVIGVLTAYYFGIKLGGVAAVVAAVLFVAAVIIPGSALAIYAGVALFVAGILFLGPKFGRASAKSEVFTIGRKLVAWALSRLRNLR